MSSIFEPSAEARQVAAVAWQMYRALVDEGFSDDQALRLVVEMLKIGITQAPPESGS